MIQLSQTGPFYILGVSGYHIKNVFLTLKIDQCRPRNAAICGISSRSTCADPESFVRGGPTLTTFFYILV